MGMTPRQILWQVELPLAIPSIIAGLRLATVATIGTATIAAAIGGGGLGVFIFRGIAMWMTSGPCWQARFRRRSWPWRRTKRWGGWSKAIGGSGGAMRQMKVGAAVAMVCAWLWVFASGADRGGSKNFTEQVVLGEMLAQQIERRLGCRWSGSSIWAERWWRMKRW